MRRSTARCSVAPWGGGGAAKLSSFRRKSVGCGVTLYGCGVAQLECGVAQLECGVAQLVVRRLAEKQARV